MLQLFDYAKHLGVSIEWAPLRAHNGEYRHDLRRIRLRQGMTDRLTRWTLAHELGHATLGHIRTMNPWVTAKQEHAADEWAALRMVDLDAYREAEYLREGHPPAIAHDLGIVTDGIVAFQSLLARLGDTVYLKPGHGVGQWAATRAA